MFQFLQEFYRHNKIVDNLYNYSIIIEHDITFDRISNGLREYNTWLVNLSTFLYICTITLYVLFGAVRAGGVAISETAVSKVDLFGSLAAVWVSERVTVRRWSLEHSRSFYVLSENCC